MRSEISKTIFEQLDIEDRQVLSLTGKLLLTNSLLREVLSYFIRDFGLQKINNILHLVIQDYRQIHGENDPLLREFEEVQEPIFKELKILS